MTASAFIAVSTNHTALIKLHRPPTIPISHKCHGLPEPVVAGASIIPSDGSTTEEVTIGGHRYEGVVKQGANDENSGRPDAGGRPHVSKADSRRQAAAAEAHDQLPLAGRDQRHPRMADSGGRRAAEVAAVVVAVEGLRAVRRWRRR